MSLYSTDDDYHGKSMASTLNHSARRMQEMREERIPSLVCGNRHEVSGVINPFCCSHKYKAEL